MFAFSSNISQQPSIRNERLVHEAAIAAAAQGNFWEVCDLIHAASSFVDRAQLLAFAHDLDLDSERFAKALALAPAPPLAAQAK